MSGEEFIIALIGIVAGTMFLGYSVARITGLIKLWMEQHHERKHGSVNSEALQNFRAETERRLQNLEAIIAEESPQQLEEPKMDMTQEIEFPEREKTPSQRQQSSSDDRLSNMLD
jgi:hypothetical protein